MLLNADNAFIDQKKTLATLKISMPPKTAEKAAKKAAQAQKAVSKGPPGRNKGSKGSKCRKESYAIYIYKVVKQVHPDPSV